MLLLELINEGESRIIQSRGTDLAHWRFFLLLALLHTLLFGVAILSHNTRTAKPPFPAEKGKRLDLRYRESLERRTHKTKSKEIRKQRLPRVSTNDHAEHTQILPTRLHHVPLQDLAGLVSIAHSCTPNDNGFFWKIEDRSKFQQIRLCTYQVTQNKIIVADPT